MFPQSGPSSKTGPLLTLQPTSAPIASRAKLSLWGDLVRRGGVVPRFEIRRLHVADVDDYRTIRLASLQTEPDAFGSLYEVELSHPIEGFVERLASSIVFGAYAGVRIVGVAAFRQDVAPKECHKGVVWGVYVQPDARGQGVAAALIAAVIDAARNVVEQLTLTVVQGNTEAIALYHRFGFTVYGVEPRARKHPGGYVDKVLMVLDLRPG